MGNLRKRYKSLKFREFEEVYKKGKKIVTPYFILFILNKKEELKVGVVASKKIGKSVQRNKAKRRLREIVRLSQNEICDNMWVILVARKGILSSNFLTAKRFFLEQVKNVKKY